MRLGIVVSGDIDEGASPFRPQPLAELDAGHTAQSDIEHQAVEPRMLRVREEGLSARRRSAGMPAARNNLPSDRLKFFPSSSTTAT